MKFDLVIVPDAQEQIDYLVEWWSTERTAAKSLPDELERVFELLTTSPHIGLAIKKRGIPGLRYHRVGDTPYRIYYVPRPKEKVVYVISVWSVVQKRKPPLRAPKRP